MCWLPKKTAWGTVLLKAGLEQQPEGMSGSQLPSGLLEGVNCSYEVAFPQQEVP